MWYLWTFIILHKRPLTLIHTTKNYILWGLILRTLICDNNKNMMLLPKIIWKQHHTIKLIPTVYYGRQMHTEAPMMSLWDQREWSPINLCDSVMDVIDLLIILRKWYIPCASSHTFICHTSVGLRNLFCQQQRCSCCDSTLGDMQQTLFSG